MVISKERYIIRLQSMKSLSESNVNGGESAVAKIRFQQELDKFKDFGFSSVEAVLNTISFEEGFVETYSDDDFVEYIYSMGGKRVALWKYYLIAGCALQQQATSAILRKEATVKIFGPKDRVENAIWLFEQLQEDLISDSTAAWGELSADQRKNDHKRAFDTSYRTTVATHFYSKECDLRKQRVAESNCLDVRSHEFMKSLVNVSQYNSTLKTSSRNGAAAGEANYQRVSNRRMSSGAKRLG